MAGFMQVGTHLDFMFFIVILIFLLYRDNSQTGLYQHGSRLTLKLGHDFASNLAGISRPKAKYEVGFLPSHGCLHEQSENMNCTS